MSLSFQQARAALDFISQEGREYAGLPMPIVGETLTVHKNYRFAEVFAAHVGRRERVLVHAPSKRDRAQLMGRTDGFKTVILPAGVGAIGELVDVTIARATMATLIAG